MKKKKCRMCGQKLAMLSKQLCDNCRVPAIWQRRQATFELFGGEAEKLLRIVLTNINVATPP